MALHVVREFCQALERGCKVIYVWIIISLIVGFVIGRELDAAEYKRDPLYHYGIELLKERTKDWRQLLAAKDDEIANWQQLYQDTCMRYWNGGV